MDRVFEDFHSVLDKDGVLYDWEDGSKKGGGNE